DNTYVAQPPDAGFRRHSRLANFQARVAQGTFFSFAGLVVEVNLLIRTAGNTHAPAAALVLVYKDDAVFSALVHRTRRTGGNTRRVDAVFTNTRQIEHEGVFNLLFDRDIHCVGIRVTIHGGDGATEVVVQVKGPFNLVDFEAINLGDGLRRGLGFLTRLSTHQIFILIGPWLVVVMDGGQVRVVEQGEQLLDAATGLGLELAAAG